MANDILVRKIFLPECPICDQAHEVEERKRSVKIKIKGENISYLEHYYHCANGKDEEQDFVPGGMANSNLLNARNAYRKKHDLLTSDEIINIRKKYGMSQVDLAKLLGWGEATISRYESKAIQDQSHDSVLKMMDADPARILTYLSKSKDKFSQRKCSEITERVTEQLGLDSTREKLTRKILKNDYAKYMTPSDDNGYILLNIDKLEAIISYFAINVNYLYKVKLMKLLWYADALSVKMYGKAITGLVYYHEPIGALPLGHYDLVNLNNLNVQEEFTSNYNSMLHFYPSKLSQETKLTFEEKKVLDKVTTKFKNMKASEIIDYMHEEKAYIETNKGEIIPFTLAKQIRNF